MRLLLPRAWAALALLVAAIPVHASSPVSIVMGPSRDGSMHDLQHEVDKLIGFGRLDVTREYVGARPGDPDPFFWVNNGTREIAVQIIDRKSPHMVLGWYNESSGRPVIDGVDDGVVFDDWRVRRLRTIVRIPSSVTRFGFYVDTDEDDGEDSDHRGHYRYFTNRLFNDIGPRGHGALHAPYDGDMQFLIYDVSRWLGSDTWLVACEYGDSGRRLGDGHGDGDNDYSDILFMVTGMGTTPTLGTSFAKVKALYR